MSVLRISRRSAALAAVAGIAGVVLAADAPRLVELGAAQRQSVSLTIYSDQIALIHDRRSGPFPAGPATLRFAEVPAGIEPRSVQVRIEGGAGAPEVREQSFRTDLISPERLLELSVGREVTLITQGQDLRETRTPATLVSIAGGPVFRIGEEIQIGHPGRVALPSLPAGLSARPTLEWALRTERAGTYQAAATYLTGGLSWAADYVLRLGAAETRGRLSAWVTIDNQTGAPFPEARLELVAGHVNRVTGPARSFEPPGVMRMAETVQMAPDFREETLSEYHLYTLDRPVSLGGHEQKQVFLLEGADVPVARRYVIRAGGGFIPVAGGGEMQAVPVEVLLEFENKKSASLGEPLPAGIVRLYQDGSEGAVRFLGEDRIGHTPVDETVSVRSGQAFDLVAERRQTDFQQRPHGWEGAWEVRIRNRKKDRVTVEDRETLPGDWRILESSQAWRKRDASTVVFSLDVPPGGESVLTFRARIE